MEVGPPCVACISLCPVHNNADAGEERVSVLFCAVLSRIYSTSALVLNSLLRHDHHLDRRPSPNSQYLGKATMVQYLVSRCVARGVAQLAMTMGFPESHALTLDAFSSTFPLSLLMNTAWRTRWWASRRACLHTTSGKQTRATQRTGRHPADDCTSWCSAGGTTSARHLPSTAGRTRWATASTEGSAAEAPAERSDSQLAQERRGPRQHGA